MSFPGSFPSQLTAIMEALMKAVVAEVTALVEDGAVELRLELRDRDQQILDKEREIEERDRVIEELRAAVEELMARGEAAVSPAEEEEEEVEEEEEDRPEQTESCLWNKEEEDTELVVKSEPPEEFASASTDSHVSLWAPPHLSATTDTADSAAACSFDAKQGTAQSCSQYSEDAEDFSQMDEGDLPVDTFLNRDQEQFYSALQPGFSLMPDLSQLQNIAFNKNVKRKGFNTKRRNYGTFRCDQCGKTFTAKCRLITHQSVHTGAKPYSCRKCGKRFSRRDNCIRHERTDPRCKDGL